ncbi:MAG: DUF5658 family protein [Maledivibacter sp.]|jgi:hypothetical protein|nr:DUF5658 family protein [Maledivibacter sp.]
MKDKNAVLKYRVSNNLILSLIFILAISDYIFTYLGINALSVISEANPLMIGFMKLPLYEGLFLRSIIIFIPLFLLKIVEKQFENPKNFRLILFAILIIQIFPNILHAIWINMYLS